MVISDPRQNPDRIVIVNFTSQHRLAEQTCLLRAGEHPFVRHETCVSYRDAILVTADGLEMLAEDGKLAWDQPLSQELLDCIRQKAPDSELPTGLLEILIEQGLG
jgi:hypothetical protein